MDRGPRGLVGARRALGLGGVPWRVPWVCAHEKTRQGAHCMYCCSAC